MSLSQLFLLWGKRKQAYTLPKCTQLLPSSSSKAKLSVTSGHQTHIDLVKCIPYSNPAAWSYQKSQLHHQIAEQSLTPLLGWWSQGQARAQYHRAMWHVPRQGRKLSHFRWKGRSPSLQVQTARLSWLMKWQMKCKKSSEGQTQKQKPTCHGEMVWGGWGRNCQ